MNLDGWIIGLHLLSFHADPSMETITPGVYAVAPSGATLGYYSNSERRPSAYAGWSWQGQHWGLTAGVVTGYERAKALPLLVPSYRFSNGMRASVIPNPKGPSALHLSWEW